MFHPSHSNHGSLAPGWLLRCQTGSGRAARYHMSGAGPHLPPTCLNKYGHFRPSDQAGILTCLSKSGRSLLLHSNLPLLKPLGISQLCQESTYLYVRFTIYIAFKKTIAISTLPRSINSVVHGFKFEKSCVVWCLSCLFHPTRKFIWLVPAYSLAMFGIHISMDIPLLFSAPVRLTGK